ncbi:MAG: GNAT family N-acetyltransferase [Verrucomicrobia bacterium]|nr:GNAT family N-acetyltransferase [Verrucomicrobiota bacterium]MBS0637583.1 GNAT family N-acetyltransferase [Verrucomicrobiota bacterium]
MNQDFTIHQATPQELTYMLALAADEGWSPGYHDQEPFYAQDPSGFFIGKLNGTPIGCISNVCYSDQFAFLGLYIVEKIYRHKGYGLKLWNHAIAYAKNRSIGLDGVIAQQPNYIKSGFRLAYRNIRCECRPIAERATNLITIDRVPFELLSAYDTSIFGIERTAFLKKWISMPNASALAKMKGSTILGYGVIRASKNGYKIGPLFAENLDIAYELYVGLQQQSKDQVIYLDVPECNSAAVELAKRLNGTKVFETARMYTKSAPANDMTKTFGVTTFELG